MGKFASHVGTLSGGERQTVVIARVVYFGAEVLILDEPTSADLATPTIDEDAIRKKLRHSPEIAKGCQIEIIMKDNQTLGHNPQNAIRWVQIAKEEVERLEA